MELNPAGPDTKIGGKPLGRRFLCLPLPVDTAEPQGCLVPGKQRWLWLHCTMIVAELHSRKIPKPQDLRL